MGFKALLHDRDVLVAESKDVPARLDKINRSLVAVLGRRIWHHALNDGAALVNGLLHGLAARALS